MSTKSTITGWQAKGSFFSLLITGSLAWSLPQIGGMEGDFLSWGAGGRALGLGKAYVALATDATASYWNPAGLAAVDRAEASALHAALWEGAAYDFVGMALPTLEIGNIGAFASLVTVGGAERRDAENTLVSGSFGMAKMAVGMAYGREIMSGLSIGVSAKYIGRSLDNQSSGFVAGDLGVRWTPVGMSWLAVAAVLQHAVSLRFGSTDDTLPKMFRAGAVFTALESYGLGIISMEVEGRESTGAIPLQWRIGMESMPFGPLTMRVGMDTWEMAGGVGFAPGGDMKDLRLDYSAAVHPDLGMSHRLSFSFAWGLNLSRERVMRAERAYADALARFQQVSTDPAAAADAERAIHEALRYDPNNAAAQRLLQRLNTPKP